VVGGDVERGCFRDTGFGGELRSAGEGGEVGPLKTSCLPGKVCKKQEVNESSGTQKSGGTRSAA